MLADLALIGELLHGRHADTVTLHLKPAPYYVSDANRRPHRLPRSTRRRRPQHHDRPPDPQRLRHRPRPDRAHRFFTVPAAFTGFVPVARQVVQWRLALHPTKPTPWPRWDAPAISAGEVVETWTTWRFEFNG